MPHNATLAVYRPSDALLGQVRGLGLDARLLPVRDAATLATERAAGLPMAGLCECRAPLRPGHLADLDQCLARHPLPWVAVVDPPLLAEPSVRELVLSRCMDYQRWPVDPASMRHSLGHALGMALLRQEVTSAAQDSWQVPPEDGLLGHSPAMETVRQQVRACARSRAPVLITGESGTGKELVARALHAASIRAGGPFVAVNCGAFPEGLIQSELFGHRRGAFTGALQDREGKVEAARNGTLFLDEIGDLPRLLQVHLLRFLQEGTIEKLGHPQPIAVDVRVIAATHVDLGRAVASGAFREDLRYRLDVLHIALPPLRERRADIALLADHYLARHAAEGARSPWGYTDAAYRALEAHDWPGNVRELVNVVRRAIVHNTGRYIDAPALALGQVAPEAAPRTLSRVRAEADRHAIEVSLRATGNNVSAASRLLNISRLSLYRLMEKYHVHLPRKPG